MKAPAVQKALNLIAAYSANNKLAAKIMKVTEEQPGDPNADKFEDRTGREETYAFKGGDVIEMLKTLKLQFEDQLKELNSAEASAASAHKLADAAKEDEIEAAERAKETKTEVKGAKGSDLATAESTLSEATSNRDADAAVLEETKTLCHDREMEYERRSKTRADEIAATLPRPSPRSPKPRATGMQMQRCSKRRRPCATIGRWSTSGARRPALTRSRRWTRPSRFSRRSPVCAPRRARASS